MLQIRYFAPRKRKFMLPKHSEPTKHGIYFLKKRPRKITFKEERKNSALK